MRGPRDRCTSRPMNNPPSLSPRKVRATIRKFERLAHALWEPRDEFALNGLQKRIEEVQRSYEFYVFQNAPEVLATIYPRELERSADGSWCETHKF